MISLHTIVAGSDPMDRRSYVTAGAALMVAKFVIDAAVIYAVTGIVWTPIDYIFPLVSLGASKTAAFPASLSLMLLAWTVPFIWFGVTMSVRRAQDAGLPTWIVVAFFLPILNYVLLGVLALAPGRIAEQRVRIGSGPAPVDEWPGRPVVDERRLLDANALLAALAGATAAIVAIVIGTIGIESYGLAVFLGTPFLLGLVTGYVANLGGIRTKAHTLVIVSVAVVFTGIGIVTLALEGAICLGMAFPITIPVAMIGGTVGMNIVRNREVWGPRSGMAMLMVLLPIGSLADRAIETSETRVVLTSVDVDAPPSRVWRHVIAFDEITEPPSWEFRLGLAYPVRARIEGVGVGALRYCEFSTGAFVEPITAWEEPSRLAFAVTDQPAPLQEWSPYPEVYAPHLKGFFQTTQGEFRLVALPGGRTRLEGRTWYSLRMAPSLYWNPVADLILHRIHDRVLRHVKALAEAGR